MESKGVGEWEGSKTAKNSNRTFHFGCGLVRNQHAGERIRSALLLHLSDSLNMQHNYHDSREETHRLAAGGFGRHVPVAHGEEGDGHEPQGGVHSTGHFGGFPTGGEMQSEQLI